MDFGKWDRIYMTNDQGAELLDMIDSKDIHEGSDHPIMRIYEYPLRRFILTVPDATKAGENFHHCYTMAGDHLEVRTLVEEPDGHLNEAFLITIDMIKLDIKKRNGPACVMLDKPFYNDATYWQWLLLQFMLINTYILSDPQKTVKIEEKEVTERRMPGNIPKNRGSRKGPNKVRLVRTYRLKKNWKAVVEKKVHDFHCKAWGVRGHFRHYKNGSIVFIQPYVKGKDREQYAGKIYELFPNGTNKIKGSVIQNEQIV